jgi:biotin carboxyl carrier protein
VRQHVFAKLDGEVQQVRVEHDSPVKKGDLLVVEHSLDLDKEAETTRGQLQQALADIDSTNRSLIDDKDMTESDKNQKIAHVAQLEQQKASLLVQMKVLDEKRELLQVKSPIDGRVVKWKVQEELQGRPVTRGQVMMEVADTSGPWELEVNMPESRMGYISQAWTEAKSANRDLPVTFILATSPSNKLQGKVEEIHRSAEVRGEEGNTVLIRVSFDQDKLREVVSEPKIGAGATAKITCGRRSVAFVWLHDLFDFIRAKVLFRM